MSEVLTTENIGPILKKAFEEYHEKVMVPTLDKLFEKKIMEYHEGVLMPMFEDIYKRFDAMDKRFDAMDKRLEKTAEKSDIKRLEKGTLGLELRLGRRIDVLNKAYLDIARD